MFNAQPTGTVISRRKVGGSGIDKDSIGQRKLERWRCGATGNGMDKDSIGQRKLERWRCGATGNGMDKDSKGQRKLEDSDRGRPPSVEGHSLE